ncbi:MAG TPA: hypothetical protein VK745_01175 [Polyangiaceae bacterium]|nr:hypothetical protein [Polyangiaceae bacterium]
MQKPVVALLTLLPLVLLAAAACGGSASDDSSVNRASGGSGGESPVACSNIASVDVAVTFNLACAPNDLTTATVSGPCAGSTGGDLTQYVKGRGQLVFVSPSEGVCHLKLTFASGFSYGADVTFTSMSDSCGRATVSPTQSTFAVDNPSSTCTDGGSAAGAGG